MTYILRFRRYGFQPRMFKLCYFLRYASATFNMPQQCILRKKTVNIVAISHNSDTKYSTFNLLEPMQKRCFFQKKDVFYEYFVWLEMSSPINLPKTTYIQTTAFISYFEIYTDICRNLGSKVILGTF